LAGRSREIDRFIDLMAEIGLVEVSRTGIAAVRRGAEGLGGAA
jgi:acetolactate synthase-1/3 small subunit